MTSPRRVPVLDVGGTHATAALVDVEAWRVVPGTLTRRRLDPHATAAGILEGILGAARCVRPAAGSGWGVAMPGPFDYARGIAHFSGVGKFDALRGADVGALLREELGAGREDVRFLNDADAFLLGEWVAGAAGGSRRAMGITLGTGVGSAFLVDGVAVHSGPGLPPQGRLHLLSLAGRPLEESVSRRAIRRRHAELTGADPESGPDVREIAARARTGDPDARRALGEPLEALGGVLGPMAAAYGATVLVVGGSFALSWDVVAPPLRAGMDAAAPGWADSCPLAPAQWVEEAGLLGAARHATRSR